MADDTGWPLDRPHNDRLSWNNLWLGGRRSDQPDGLVDQGVPSRCFVRRALPISADAHARYTRCVQFWNQGLCQKPGLGADTVGGVQMEMYFQADDLQATSAK